MLKTVLLLFAIHAAPAAAQDGRSARYAFVPVDHGTLRLDTRTGAVSLCARMRAEISCRPMHEATGGAEFARLERRLDDVGSRLAALEGRTRPTTNPEPGGALQRVAVLADRIVQPLLGLVRGVKGDPD